MSKRIQIRAVPEDVYEKLKALAAREGLSLSKFLARELTRAAERTALEEWLKKAAEVPELRSERR